MGRYSKISSPLFEARLERHFETILDQLKRTFLGELQALFLVGAYGRGEGTIFRRGTSEEPFNDYDLCAILSPHRLKKGRTLAKELSIRLSREVGTDVNLAVESEKSLHHCTPTLMSYELRESHHSLFGDGELLRKLIPARRIDEIPLEEGTRLLLSRGKLLMDLLMQKIQKPIQAHTFIWKVYLAIGDSLLLKKRRYSMSDRERGTIIENVRENSIPYGDFFIDLYQKAIAWKEDGCANQLQKLAEECSLEDLIDRFSSYFLWYERERLGEEFPLKDYQKILQRQPKERSLRFRAIYHNFSALQMRAILPAFSWLFLPPRTRLYATLLPLLKRKNCPLGCLGLKKGEETAAYERFYFLKERWG